MIRQRDAKWWMRLNGALRAAMVARLLPGRHPLVNEYPKSGGSWLAQMLAGAMGLAFPRNRLPGPGSCLMHGHYRAVRVRVPTVMVWRDGRDVMVSLYHHRLGENAFSSGSETRAAREALGIDDPSDIRRHLPRFIELVARGGTHPRIGWQGFVAEWHDHPRVRAHLRYEDMLTDAAGALTTAAAALGQPIADETARAIAERYSFAAQAGRTRGQEDQASYLRKGIAGDWKNVFSAEAAEVFDHHMGAGLVTLGYEGDRSWATRFAARAPAA